MTASVSLSIIIVIISNLRRILPQEQKDQACPQALEVTPVTPGKRVMTLILQQFAVETFSRARVYANHSVSSGKNSLTALLLQLMLW